MGNGNEATRGACYFTDVVIVALTMGLAVGASPGMPAHASIITFIFVLIGSSSRFSTALQETAFFTGLAYCAMLGNSKSVQFPLAVVFDKSVLLRPGLLILALAVLVPAAWGAGASGSGDGAEPGQGATFPVFVSWVGAVTAVVFAGSFALFARSYVLEREWLLTGLANCLVLPCALIVCRRNMTRIRQKMLRKILCAGLALVACGALYRGWRG